MILIGEMRDEETVRTALSAAETGHLVLSTVHTVDAAESVNRIIDFFKPEEQKQARAMLAGTLKGVVSQRLVPTPDGKGRVATCEVLRMTGRVRDMIMDPEQTGQLHEVISEGAYYGMQTFDQALLDHVQNGRVTMEDALKAAIRPARLQAAGLQRRAALHLGGPGLRPLRRLTFTGGASRVRRAHLDPEPQEGGAVQSTLGEFQESQSQEAFHLQNSKLLKVRLDAVTIQAKLGSMVAYQGDVKFEHAGSGGMGRMLKKAVSGEGTSLMKMTGTGEVFLADTAQDIHLLKLENDAITCNGANVLAFDAGIDWDITKVQGAGAMMGGSGLFNMALQGTGWVAIISDGPPVLLNTGDAPTFADPQAAITWSSSVSTSIKTDVNLKNFIGRGSGESLQMAFQGQGWVLVQPSEGRIVPVAGGGGAAACWASSRAEAATSLTEAMRARLECAWLQRPSTTA